MKRIKLVAAAILLNIFFCIAGDTNTVTKGMLDTAIKRTNEKIDGIEKTTKELKDSLGKTLRQQPIPESSLFTGWETVKKNPCPIYNGNCESCPAGTKPCVSKSTAVIQTITWLLLAVILFVSFKYFFSSALCKDESFTNIDGDLHLRPVKERPYSYARTQLFWWCIIIFTCYGVFYALYGNLLPLNPTCIILLGGGLATQLLGKTIDKNQIDNTAKEDDKSNTPRPVRHQDTHPSKGLLTDILSDDNGISIHRLQSVALNIIYGIGFFGYFLNAVNCCQYPFIDFEAWQLTLLGISTAGYLGMKTTENPKTTVPTRTNKAEKSA